MKAIQNWRWAQVNGRRIQQSFIVRPDGDLDTYLQHLLDHRDFTLPVPNIVDAEDPPTMNITNQINAALNDIRTTLIELSATVPGDERLAACDKARYQLDLAMEMVRDHTRGRSISWSDRKPQVDEEFS